MPRLIWPALAWALLVTPAAAGDCPKADELGLQLLALQWAMLVVIDEARPVCAEPALKRACARYRVEIAGFARQLREVEAERAAARLACSKIIRVKNG